MHGTIAGGRAGHVYRFDGFTLYPDHRGLTRGQTQMALAESHLQVLRVLVASAGRLVAAETLIATGWGEVLVTADSLFQAIRQLRQAIGPAPDGRPYIETRVKKGYRFTGIVAVEDPEPGALPAPVAGALEPFRAFVDGRAALETLSLDAVDRATDAFTAALGVDPGFSDAKVGLANACFLRFESTRADSAPNLAALEQATAYATDACQSASPSGDAWSTLACVLYRSGKAEHAIAAARKAARLEPHEWRHHLRLAFVSWGAERLRAANRVLALCPGLPLAHWFAATVFVARDAFDTALDHLRAGCAGQDSQSAGCTPHADGGRFAAVGLHLLHGLVLAARAPSTDGEDDEDAALAALSRELAFEHSGHIYARECSANAWYAIGALHVRRQHVDQARAAFQ